MKKGMDKLSGELLKKYGNILTKNEIEDIIESNTVFEDMPVSTGKKLVIEYLEFNGVKKNGTKIDFKKEFNEGINIIIADNLKGKSTIFKIIKTALVGDYKSIKADVKEWIHHVIVGFRINEKQYTIKLAIENRFKGALYSISVSEFINNKGKSDMLVFEANSVEEYCEEIQKFFFNQFSYYSLKWTQKSSSKISNELCEAKASWKTYFKSIYLESKDSNSFYGAQGQKTFQMLLGLENTHLINQLVIKKEMLQSELGKLKEYINRKDIQNDPNQREIKTKLDKIQNQLKDIKENSNIKELLNLQNEHKKLLEKINTNNAMIFDLRKEYKDRVVKQRAIQQEIDEYEAECRRIGREISKSKKLLIDLKEYIEIGQFFSNLDIKYCPSCNHEMKNEKNKIHDNTCPLCHENVSKEADNKQYYLDKINVLESLIIKYEEDKNLLCEKISILKVDIEKLDTEIEMKTSEMNLLENSKLDEELSTINSTIKLNSEKDNGLYELEKQLIADQAVLNYKLHQESEDTTDVANIEKTETVIKVLNDAIQYMDNERYEKSKSILDTLATTMLNEIHEFGLDSISDIRIDNKFNVIYTQNEIEMKFNDIAEGEQLRVKLAFYLALIQMDIEKNYGRHTRFLIIDSPNKEEGDAKYLDGLKEVLININKRYDKDLQILIGTATREFTNIVEHQSVYGKGEYVF